MVPKNDQKTNAQRPEADDAPAFYYTSNPQKTQWVPGYKQAALPENGAQEAPAVPSEIKTNDDRVAYLGSFGWEVCEEPKQTQEVRIPTDPSEVFERYNDLQISQGFDLHEYAGKSVKRYVYEITNYPNSEDTYYATLLIYKNAVIGGDVCSSAQGGTMHSLNMPK